MNKILSPPPFFPYYCPIKSLPNCDIFKTAKYNSHRHFSFYSICIFIIFNYIIMYLIWWKYSFLIGWLTCDNHNIFPLSHLQYYLLLCLFIGVLAVKHYTFPILLGIMSDCGPVGHHNGATIFCTCAVTICRRRHHGSCRKQEIFCAWIQMEYVSFYWHNHIHNQMYNL